MPLDMPKQEPLTEHSSLIFNPRPLEHSNSVESSYENSPQLNSESSGEKSYSTTTNLIPHCRGSQKIASLTSQVQTLFAKYKSEIKGKNQRRRYPTILGITRPTDIHVDVLRLREAEAELVDLLAAHLQMLKDSGPNGSKSSGLKTQLKLQLEACQKELELREGRMYKSIRQLRPKLVDTIESRTRHHKSISIDKAKIELEILNDLLTKIRFEQTNTRD